MKNRFIDPYAQLQIPYHADEETIRRAFHQKIRENPDNTDLLMAYEMIRNEEKRKEYKWMNSSSYIMPPPIDESPEADQFPIEALARELAFLSEWEAGRD